jgi:hypothetical protein
MADNTFAGLGLPPLAPPSPYGEVPGSNIATQGTNGVPVPFPAFPGSPPAYPPSGNQNLDFEAPQVPVSGGAGPRRADERPSEYLARKRAAGEPVTPEDMLAVDAEQQALMATLYGGGASSTTTSTERQNDSPLLRELRDVRSRAVQGYGDRMSQAGAQAAQYGDAQSQMLATRGDQLQQETVAAQERQQAQSAELLRRQTEVDKASKDYVKASQNIDPNRIMHGGRGVLAALAMAAGAYGATLGKTQNFAQQIIDHAIDRDLSAQQMALNGKKDALTQTQQAFQNYRSIYQDDAAARAAVRADAREMFATQLESLNIKMKGNEQQTNILNMRDQLLLDNNRLRQEQAERAAGRVQQSTTTQSGIPGAGTGDVLERYTKAAAAAKGINEQVKGGPDNSDKELYNASSKAAAPWLAVLQESERLKKLAGETNWAERKNPFDEKGGQFRNADIALQAAFLQAITGAAFSPEQKKQAEALVHEGAITSTQYQHKIQAMQSFLVNQIQSHMTPVHAQLQQQYFDRLRAGKVDPALINAISNGSAPQSPAEDGASMGARKPRY